MAALVAACADDAALTLDTTLDGAVTPDVADATLDRAPPRDDAGTDTPDAAPVCARPCGPTETCRDGVCAARPAWPRRIGGTGDDGALGVALDAAGNVYVVGSFAGTVDTGRGLFTSAGGTDAFVASFTADGAPRWARRFGAAGHDRAVAITVGSDGNPCVAGEFSGTVDFGMLRTSAGGADVFVTSLDAATGAPRWSRALGGSDDETVASIVGGAERFALAITFAGRVDPGGGIVASAGGTDALLMMLDANTGLTRWSRRHGGLDDDAASGVAIDTRGAPVLAGTFRGRASVGDAVLVSTGERDVFLVAAAADGSARWARRLGGSMDDVAAAVALDRDGNAYVSGDFAGLADYGGALLTSVGGRDAFIASVSPTGVARWSRRFGSDGDDRAAALAALPDGTLAVAGSFTRFVDDGRMLLRGGGGGDAFVVWIGAGGAPSGGARFGGATADEARGVALSGSGDVFAVGAFTGRAEVGMVSLASSGGADAFVARVAR